MATPIDDKLMKAAIKEGGKKGVEIEGVADMGGLTFFCTSVETPDGDTRLIKVVMDAMNAEHTPGDEERKGCSGHVGKMILSSGANQLAIMAYVPKEHADKINATEWVQHVLDAVTGGKIETSGAAEAIGVVAADADKGKYPIKDRDVAQKASIAFLRLKKVFPEEKDESSDDFVFGDDELGNM